MELSNINAAYGLCESLYGITPSESEFEDLAFDAWSRIGTKHTRLYRYVGDVKNQTLELPCNVDLIESVHIPIPDAQMTSNQAYNPWVDSLWIEGYSDIWKGNKDPYWSGGKLVKYDEGNNELYFSHNYPKVMVIYHGVILDDETDLPLVNDKELRAIASFVAYVSLYKEGIKKRDANIMRLAQVVKEDWLRNCNAARVSEHLTQNDMDAIFDAKASWCEINKNEVFGILLIVSIICCWTSLSAPESGSSKIASLGWVRTRRNNIMRFLSPPEKPTFT